MPDMDPGRGQELTESHSRSHSADPYCRQLEGQPLLTENLVVLYELGSQYDYALHMHRQQHILQPTESSHRTRNHPHKGKQWQ